MITHKPNQQINPTGIYIHFPWCIQKCPYCDFNSHTLKGVLPQQQYVDRLIKEIIEMEHIWPKDRLISSIFMGGGTPSLFTAEYLEPLMDALKTKMSIPKNCEITMEVNPGSKTNFYELNSIGVNRVSIGAQSFDDKHLKKLGRIHKSHETMETFKNARKAGINNINIDIMFALGGQSIKECLDDLQQAIALEPEHISWYQLTIEPNTLFYLQPPATPKDEKIDKMYQQGRICLENSGYAQYEVSAYSKQKICLHNFNYWSFGDYLGIGAGAHSKWQDKTIIRRMTHKHPKHYLLSNDATAKIYDVPKAELLVEYFLNRSRMPGKVAISQIAMMTQWPVKKLVKILNNVTMKPFIDATSANIIVFKPAALNFNNNFMAELMHLCEMDQK